MDAKAYEKICAEFNVDKNTDWRQKLDDNGGLGIIFNYITRTGYQPLKGFSYDAHQMSFTEYNKGKLHIDYISQQHRNAWSTFILDKSNGFTRPGVERINESIRTYCCAILGSQSQIISWPTLFFFEVASSLIVLHCTLRKIQPNIQGGGA